MKLNKTLLVISFATFMALKSQAAIIVFDNDSTNSTWETASNWDTNLVATGQNQITIGSGFDVTRASDITLSKTGAGTIGSILIEAGGSLAVNGRLRLEGDPASVNILGTLSFTTGGIFSHTINNGTQGVFSLSGTLRFDDYDNSVASLRSANGSAAIDFVAEGATLEALTMSTADFTNFNSKFGINFFSINGIGINGTGIANAEGGFYLKRTDTANSATLVLTAVPEPSSAILFGLSGFALFIRRRK